jgi:hypothetical protein
MPDTYVTPIPDADEEPVPFVEGARHRRLMLTSCESCGPMRMPVEAVFEDINDEISLPKFRTAT